MVLANGTIAIHSVTEKDSGDYLCVARNKIGDDYVLLRVNVITRPAKIKQKQQHTSQEVIYGEDLKVDCVASGLPNPEISWALPDGTMVNPVKTRDSSSGGRSRRYDIIFQKLSCITLYVVIIIFTMPFHNRYIYENALFDSVCGQICGV